MEKVGRIGVACLFCFVLFLGCLLQSFFQKSEVFCFRSAGFGFGSMEEEKEGRRRGSQC